MSWTVLVTATSFGKVSVRGREALEAAGCHLRWNPHRRPLTQRELMELVPGVDGIIAGVDPFTAEVLARADRLRVIARRGVGVDGVDLEAAARHGVAVTVTPDANKVAVAELTLALMLAVSRGLVPAASALQDGRWERPLGRELRGKVLGLLGLGRIGREVAAGAAGLGMRVLASDPAWSGDAAAAIGITLLPMAEVLAAADFVSLHLPLMRQTEGIIGEDELRRMRPTAYLINTARGELVQEGPLHRALRAGWIAGAALDVFRREPPFGSPLLDLPNLLATPHLASQTQEAVDAMDLGAVENLLAVLSGQRPPDAVVMPHPRTH